MHSKINLDDITRREINKFFYNQVKLQKQANSANNKKRLEAVKSVLAYHDGQNSEFHKLRKFAQLFISLYEKVKKAKDAFVSVKSEKYAQNIKSMNEMLHESLKETQKQMEADLQESWKVMEARRKLEEFAKNQFSGLYDIFKGIKEPVVEKFKEYQKTEKEKQLKEYIESLKKEYADYLEILEKQQQPQTTQSAQQQSDQPQSQSEGLLSRVGRYALPGAGGVLLGLGLADLMDKKYKKIWPYIKLVSGLGLLALPLLLSSWKK